MRLRRAASRSLSRRRARDGAVILEFALCLPIVVLATAGCIQVTFAGFANQVMRVAAIEAAREGARVFPASLPVVDPQGEPSPDPDDFDDVADRIALAVERYVALHRMEVEPRFADDNRRDRPNARVIIQRGAQTVERGDATIACVVPGAPPAANEIVVTVAVRVVDPAEPTGLGSVLPPGMQQFNQTLRNAVWQASSRAVLE